MDKLLFHNAQDLTREIAWFEKVLETRIRSYLDPNVGNGDVDAIPPPRFNKSASNWAMFLGQNDLQVQERLALVLGMMPHLSPQSLDVFLIKNSAIDQPFTEFGGRIDQPQRGFLPTGETIMFLLGGRDLKQRFSAMRLFQDKHVFAQKGWLTLTDIPNEKWPMHGLVTVSKELLTDFTHG